MPSITEHHSQNSTKLLLMGESGSGKTGSLVSLVLAGYKLRIFDLDNGIDLIKNFLTDPKSPYYEAAKKIDLQEAVQYQTITEHMKSVNGKLVPAAAKAWIQLVSQLIHWKETKRDENGVELLGEDKKPIVVKDLGEPRRWDKNTIAVIDSLTFGSQYAFNFHQALQGQLGTDTPTKGYDPRSSILGAQTQLEKLLTLLYDSDFQPNVIVVSHIMYRLPEGPNDSAQADKGGGTLEYGRKGFPNAIGKALSPKIPRYFNNVLQCITVGSGQSEKHKITSAPYAGVSAKSTAPARLQTEYDISTGLAEFFRAVRGE